MNHIMSTKDVNSNPTVDRTRMFPDGETKSGDSERKGRASSSKGMDVEKGRKREATRVSF